MPVTAKLSKQFYDRLGEAVTSELVDWFNQVDAAYEFDLREMNELNFARFGATLEQRLTAFEANVERRLNSIEQRITPFESKVDRQIAALDAKIDARFDLARAETAAAIEKALANQTRFFFLAWAVLLASNIALWFR